MRLVVTNPRVFKHTTIIGLLIFMLIGGCGSVNNENNLLSSVTVKKQYFENGNLKYEGEFLNDSIKEGYFNVYDVFGNLINEYQFKNNEKEGMQTSYYVSGAIQGQAYYEAGLQHGESIWYYEDGTKKSEGLWKEGEEYGAVTWYYENGKPRLFNVYDFAGSNCYVIDWNENGEKLNEEGLIFSRNASAANFSDTVRVGEEFILQITVPDPPGTQTKIFIGNLNDSNNIYNLEQCQIESNTATFKTVYKTSGLKKFIIIGELVEDGTVKRDTSYSEYHINQ